MKSVFNRDIVRSISSSLGRYLAIAGIVALGCGFYAGLRMTAPDMHISGDEFYDGTELYDILLVSSLGFSDSQLETARATEGVEAACAAKSTDIMALLDGEQYAMRVISFDVDAAAASSTDDGVHVLSEDSSYLNRLILERGSWPTEADECVLSADRVMSTPIEIGDTVEVLYGSQDLDGVLTVRAFKVTGLVHTSSYVSAISIGSTSLGSGGIQQIVYVPEKTFEEDFPCSQIFVKVKGADELFAGSDEYQHAIDEVVARFEENSGAIAKVRYDDIRGDAQSKLDDAKAEYNEQKALADKRIAEGQNELVQAAAKLADAARQIASGQEQYDTGVSELADQRAQAEEQLATALKELEDAQAEVEYGEEQLEVAREELAEHEAEYADGLAQWNASKAQYDEALAQYEASAPERQQVASALNQALTSKSTLEARIEQARAAGMPDDDPAMIEMQNQLSALNAQISYLQQLQKEFEAAKAALDAAKEKLDAGEAVLRDMRSELDAAQETISARAKELEDAKAQIADGWAQYREKEAYAASQLDQAQKQLDAAADELARARSELAAGQSEYNRGLAEFESGRAEAYAQLGNAQGELDDAQKQIDDLEEPKIYVLDRTSNYGVVSYNTDAERVDNIARVFPFIFFLVAALVALTTMTRMVEEERVIIGTYKALGYSRARITGKYLAYAASASIIGAVIGIGILSQVLPYVISKAYAIIYNVPPLSLPLPVDMPLALLSAGLGVGITLVSTWAAVAATLREQPASLMLPRAPSAGKKILLQRVTPIWQRLSFSWKVTCRNLFRYKKRLWMTIVGIAGCTALLLTGLGLHDAIWDIIDKQFGPIVNYNVVVQMADDATEDEISRTLSYMEDTGGVSNLARAERANMKVSSADHNPTGLIIVIPEDAKQMNELIITKERVGQVPIELNEQSVIMTEKMAKTLNVRPGDCVTVYEQDEIGNAVGDGHTLTITDVMEYYVGHELIVGADAWSQNVGTALDYSAIYGTCTEDASKRAAVTEGLHARDEVETVAYNDETIDSYRKMLTSVNMIVVVLVVAAAGLAFIVLYNLTNINITERRREIASLKVLGFTRREVNAYIFREIVLLTLIGAAFGLVLGYFLEGFVVTTAEVDYVMFGREIHLVSYLLGYAITIVFSAIVMFAMRHKLAGIDMVESLKSID
ncbi:MAG: FtsX-like permease family protein [Eggerthellaceae bacterium]|nr:FtsX-like permease family protein [Eggerthellaceae bacterium]